MQQATKVSRTTGNLVDKMEKLLTILVKDMNQKKRSFGWSKHFDMWIFLWIQEERGLTLQMLGTKGWFVAIRFALRFVVLK